MYRQKGRKPAMVLASLLAIVYISYRIGFTLNLITPYAVFASLLLLVGEVYGIAMMLLYFLQIWDVAEPPCQPVLPDRTVDVFIATYNEDPRLLRATIQGCLRLDYPHRTYVLDDGRRPEIQALAEELGAAYVTRPNNQHAKAGNLNNALKQSDGEFVIVFDADHVPEKHFITRLIGYFADEKLAFVQTPHAFYNLDSFQASYDADKKRYWEEGDVFSRLVQQGRNRFHCACFAGSAAMFRRKALEDVGGFAVETVTEDLHTGLRVNAKGWKSLAISERLIAGQAAPDVTTFHAQRLRWAKGNLSILSYDNPLTMPGLTIPQRLCHFAACGIWLRGPFSMTLYLTPVLFLFTGVAPVAEYTWTLLVMVALYLSATWSGLALASNGHFSFWNTELFDMMSFWTKTRGAVQALLWRGRGPFVVTSKRGRQSKSIWPLLRPHMVLFLVTVLALCWGWGGFLLGLSDNWSNLILATFWSCFYASLAFLILRRGLAPDDARYDYRHPVALGLTYRVEGGEPAKGAPRLGLTVDVSASGLSILSYEPLEPGAVLAIELQGAGNTLCCRGRVAWTKELFRSEVMPMQGFRNGVALEDLTGTQLDVLQHLCSHYAVSRQYHDLVVGNHRTARRRASNGPLPSPGRGLLLIGGSGSIPVEASDAPLPSRGRRLLRIRGSGSIPVAAIDDPLPSQGSELDGPCFAYRLPVALEAAGDGAQTAYGGTAYGCMETLARSGMTLLLPIRPAPGTEYHFGMGTPFGNLQGKVKVQGYDRLPLGGQTYYLCTFSFLDFGERDRAILDELVGPLPAPKDLLPVLKPRRQKRRLPLLSPAAALGVILLPLLVAQTWVYFWYRQDDFHLRDIAAAPAGAWSGDQPQRITEEVRRISDLTDRERHPDNDRLLLLRRAWQRVGDGKQVDRLTTTLAARYPNNVDMQSALLDVHVKNRDLEQARAVYQHITSLFGYRFVSTTRKIELLVAVARCGAHSGDIGIANDYFAQALQLDPQDRTLRREYAGILLEGGRPQEALSLYGVADEERRAADRFLIASAHGQLNHYVEAERECRLALQEAPEDIPLRLLLAETLRAAGRRQKALALYARIAAVDPLNERLRKGLAFDAVGEGEYSRALDLFRSLLAKDSKRPELVRGFVDAAAGADRLSKADRDLVLRLYEQIDRADRRNDLVLDRLSWALQKMGEYERSAVLLRGLVLDGGRHRDRRLRLGFCLGKLNRDAQADEVLASLGNDPDGIGVRVGLRLDKGDTATAEKICRELLADSPDEPQTLNLLAITLATAKKYEQAEKIFQRLARLRPNDTPQIRLAEVSLWNKDYPTAVARYQQLLGDTFDRPVLWQGFADAAAGCKGRLTKDQKQVAIKLATLFADRKDVRIPTLTRLGYALSQAGAPPELTSSLLERAFQNLPRNDLAARKELAGVLAAAGMTDQALQLYEGLPLTVQEQGQVVDVYVAAGQFDEAEHLARKLCQSRPDDGELRFHLANVLAWSRRYDKAVQVYEEMLKKKPEDSRVQATLALVHLWARRYDKSLSLYRGVLLAHPELKTYYKGYIDAAACATRLDARIDGPIITRLVDWARRDCSEDLETLPRLAWVCQRAGNKPAAVALLQLARKTAPEDDTLTLQLADLFYDMGRYGEAEQLYLVVARRTLPPRGEGKGREKTLSSAGGTGLVNVAVSVAR